MRLHEQGILTPLVGPRYHGGGAAAAAVAF